MEKKVKKRIWKRWWLWVGLLIVGGIIVVILVNKRKAAGLVTTQIQRGRLTEELVISGKIQAEEDANLMFQSGGEVSWIGVKEGESVKKGQVLAKLDTVSLNTTYMRAVADLREAQATLARVYDEVKNHDKDESFSQREDRTTAEVAKDKAYEAVIAAEKSLRNAALKAPFDGVVAKINHPYTGINTLATEVQIEVLNPATLYFEVLADQTDLAGLAEGQKVKMVLDSYPEEVFGGEIKTIGLIPKAGEASTVYQIKIGFEQLDLGRFRVGMSGDARMVLMESEEVLYVPREFINSDKRGKYIKVGSAKNKVYIEEGVEGEQGTEIKGQISQGEVVYD